MPNTAHDCELPMLSPNSVDGGHICTEHMHITVRLISLSPMSCHDWTGQDAPAAHHFHAQHGTRLRAAHAGPQIRGRRPLLHGTHACSSELRFLLT